MFGGSAARSISSFRTDANTCDIVSPSNSFRPVTISHNTTPNDQLSARPSAAIPAACSGAIYAAVPRITPARVWCEVRVGENDRLLSWT